MKGGERGGRKGRERGGEREGVGEREGEKERERGGERREKREGGEGGGGEGERMGGVLFSVCRLFLFVCLWCFCLFFVVFWGGFNVGERDGVTTSK